MTKALSSVTVTETATTAMTTMNTTTPVVAVAVAVGVMKMGTMGAVGMEFTTGIVHAGEGGAPPTEPTERTETAGGGGGGGRGRLRGCGETVSYTSETDHAHVRGTGTFNRL